MSLVQPTQPPTVLVAIDIAKLRHDVLIEASITFAELHHRSGRIIRHSLLCSSIRFGILTVLPSCVLALTKS